MVGPGVERFDFQDQAEVKPGPERREDQESPASRRQAQLQQAQRLASLGQLAREIAQDFNNLLAVILGYATFVSAELAAPSGPDSPERLESVRRDLGQIALAAERAASRTCQPLDFVHPAVVHPHVVDLDDVVTDAQEMLRQALAEHVELVTTLAGDLWPDLADPTQQAVLGAIMVGAAGYLSKRTRGADLVSAVRTVASGPSILDRSASHPVVARMPERTASEDPAAALTGQEKRVLELIGQGLTNRQIAERMFLAEKTAKNYVSSLLAKLGMHRRTEAAAFAVRHAPDHHDALTLSVRPGSARSTFNFAGRRPPAPRSARSRRCPPTPRRSPFSPGPAWVPWVSSSPSSTSLNAGLEYPWDRVGGPNGPGRMTQAGSRRK
jgi:DNA-binding NarL/FixJ family response regulator